MTTASADFSPCFKLKKKKRPLLAMFRAQRLHAGAEVDMETIERIVDEEVARLLEGGPGSGRYPAGTGEHPSGLSPDTIDRLRQRARFSKGRADRKNEERGKKDLKKHKAERVRQMVRLQFEDEQLGREK